MNKQNIIRMAVLALANGGLSFNLEGQTPTTGFMVALSPYSHQSDITNFLPSLENYIAEYKNHIKDNTYFSVWVNGKTATLDISQNIQAKEDALYFGIIRNQYSIYDVQNKVALRVPVTGQKVGTYSQMNAYAKHIAYGNLESLELLEVEQPDFEIINVLFNTNGLIDLTSGGNLFNIEPELFLDLYLPVEAADLREKSRLLKLILDKDYTHKDAAACYAILVADYGFNLGKIEAEYEQIKEHLLNLATDNLFQIIANL